MNLSSKDISNINEDIAIKNKPFTFKKLFSQIETSIKKNFLSNILSYIYFILNSHSSSIAQRIRCLYLLKNTFYKKGLISLSVILFYFSDLLQYENAFNTNDHTFIHVLLSFIIQELIQNNLYLYAEVFYKKLKACTFDIKEHRYGKEIETSIQLYENTNKTNELDINKLLTEKGLSCDNFKNILNISKENFIKKGKLYIVINTQWLDLLEKWVNDNNQSFPFEINNCNVLIPKQNSITLKNYLSEHKQDTTPNQTIINKNNLHLIRFFPHNIYTLFFGIFTTEMKYTCSFRKECLLNELELINVNMLFIINTEQKSKSISFVQCIQLFKHQITSLEELYTDISEQLSKQIFSLLSEKKIQINIYSINNRRVYDEIQLAQIFDLNNYYNNSDSLFLITNINDFYKLINNTFIVCDIYQKNAFIINQTKCIECQTIITQEGVNNICSYCNYGIFCSKKCSFINFNHIKFHYFLSSLFFDMENIQYQTILMLNNALINKEIFTTRSVYPKKYMKAKGFKNLGNTCYMSVSLQCLFHTEIFVYYLLNSFYVNISFHYTDHPLLSALKTLLNDYYYNQNIRVMDPSDFKIVRDVVLPQFKGKEQQDANEFFIQLLNELDKEFKVISKENSIINDIFMGETSSKVTCDVCKNNSIKIEEFMFLQLDVPVLKNKKKKYIEVKYFHYTCLKTFKLACIKKKIKFEENTTFQHIKTKLIDMNIDKNNPIITVILNKKTKRIINTIHDDSQLVQTYLSNENELVCYEVHSNNSKECVFVHRIIKVNDQNTNDFVLDYPVLVTLININITISKFIRFYQTLLNSFINNNTSNNNTELIHLYYCHYTTSKSKYGCSLCNQKNTNCCSILNVFQIDGLIADIFIKPPNAFITLFAYDGLEIKDNISSFIQEDTKHKEVDIYDCLKSYFNDIVFDGDNKYFCDTCKQYNKAVKTISLKKYPMILIVQLNRQNNYQVTSTNVIKNMFSQNVKNDTLVKYSDYIYFGENENKYKYELYAVVIHTLIYHCVWHYICYCKSTINNNWTLFNDNKVNEVSDINEIIDKDACLLFYKRMT